MNLDQKIIKPKLGLLELAKSLESISSACKAMGYSRDSYLLQTPISNLIMQKKYNLFLNYRCYDRST